MVLTALWALGESESEDPRIAKEAISVLKRGRSVSMKVQAVNLLGARKETGAIGVLIPLLRHREWRLRAASVQALASIRHRDCVEPLIDRLAVEKGRLAFDIGPAGQTIYYEIRR